MKTIIVLGRWVEHGSNWSNFLFYMLVVRGLTVYQSVDCSVKKMERTCIYMIHMSIANKAELVGGLEHEWIIVHFRHGAHHPNPIDELTPSFLKMVKLHHQPGWDLHFFLQFCDDSFPVATRSAVATCTQPAVEFPKLETSDGTRPGKHTKSYRKSWSSHSKWWLCIVMLVINHRNSGFIQL